MINDQTIDRAISKILVRDNEIKKSLHTPSGKLSASGLGKPLQSQILKTIGVPTKDLEEYTLRYFKRGEDIEEWVAGLIPNLVERQKLILYRNVIGYIDTVVDMSNYESKLGIMPCEIKSVKNSKYARLLAQKQPDRSHALQACLYAMAMDTDKFGIVYIAADDLRITHWVIDTDKYRAEVEQIITDYDNQLKLHKVPAFVAKENWQSNPMYNDYPEWINLTEEECMAKLEKEYPISYQLLLSK